MRTVRSCRNSSKTSMATHAGDKEIRERVERELERCDLAGVRVKVSRGRVTLSGAVDSYAKKLAARDAAHRGAGVSELADNVQVCLPGTSTRTDREVEAAARRALEWDIFVPERRIRLFVRRGRVRLEGDVDYRWQREDATRVVRHLAGVADIENRIRVRDVAPGTAPAGGGLERLSPATERVRPGIRSRRPPQGRSRRRAAPSAGPASGGSVP